MASSVGSDGAKVPGEVGNLEKECPRYDVITKFFSTRIDIQK